MTKSIKEALEEHGITPGEIKDALWQQGWEEGKAYMEGVLKHADELQKAATISELLDHSGPRRDLGTRLQPGRQSSPSRAEYVYRLEMLRRG